MTKLPKQKGVCVDSQTKHFNDQWTKHFALRQLIQEEQKGIYKGNPTLFC